MFMCMIVLMDEFVEVFDLVDKVYLCDIFGLVWEE